ncbi:glyoxalase superfamily protein [Mesorhizobium sp. BAC0120]|uniref:glyoxalase superfamily protein n=1 Tax=Mesorhizobium sp. BAC0120 TaxID=3090670 RepID=UPI00298CA5E6|nr:glyoxalase superfamily protein [Mesorhizobium sp. BAC0120]MDW6024910.1 glyoxalase superfamily protein [Mesorhizobium sp. BAC0120]
MDKLSRSKSMAKALRKALAERQVDLPHSACLEIVARQNGFRDWNVWKAASDEEVTLSMAIMVEHSREEEATRFYEAAFDAVRIGTYVHADELVAVDLRIGETKITVSGSNPRRELEPVRGGPFYPKGKGSVSSVLRLEVRDPEAVLRKAVEAGAVIRDELQVSTEGYRVASVFDPFGHIWGLMERGSSMQRGQA